MSRQVAPWAVPVAEIEVSGVVCQIGASSSIPGVPSTANGQAQLRKWTIRRSLSWAEVDDPSFENCTLSIGGFWLGLRG